jgi:hypothetical protein
MPSEISIDDLTPVMGEPAVAVTVTASDEVHLKLSGLWAQHELVIEGLDERVRALPKPDQG